MVVFACFLYFDKNTGFIFGGKLCTFQEEIEQENIQFAQNKSAVEVFKIVKKIYRFSQ